MVPTKQNCYLGGWCCALILSVLFCSSQVQAQGTPAVPPVAPPAGPVDNGGDDGNNNDLFGAGGGGGGTAAGDNGDAVDIDDAATLDLGGQGVDNRNQGFIGATAPGVTENNFVGAASQTFGALAEGATFGGGVNAGTTSSVPSGAGGGGGGRGGAGGFGAIAGGGSIIRSSLRTRLRPSFTAPIIAPQVIEGNFYNNIARQPTAQSLVGRYQVFVENKTATVVGTVNTQADADRLIRQLRLQPGIYGIVNQLQVTR